MNDFSKFGLEDMEKHIIDPLKKPLGILKIKIETLINFIPIYNDYLKNIKGLSLFDAAELIVLINDVDLYPRDNFISYAGFSPIVSCKKGYTGKMKKNKDYSNCKVIGDEKSVTANVSYNERLKKQVIKIVDKLIQYNDEYQDSYNNEWAIQRIKNPNATKKHITYKSKRKLCIKFLKEYRRQKVEILKRAEEDE